MMYESYKDNRVYGGQSRIMFPRQGTEDDKTGEGTVVFLVAPNREKAIECISDPLLGFVPSLYKRFVTEGVFKEKVGTKRVVRMERGKTDQFYLNQRDLPLKYVPYATRHVYTDRKKNLVNDISRWMELVFSRLDNLSVKRKCAEFMRIFKARINDPMFAKYQKIVLFDMNSWVQTSKGCIMMNKKLLNNPLSILFYSAYYYPELMEDLPAFRLMVVNRQHQQLYLCESSFITKRSYPKIKAKLSQFKDLLFSIEDETPTEDSEANISSEVNSEIINSFKEEIRSKLRHNLLGAAAEDDPFAHIEDITGQVAEPFDDFDQELEREAANIDASEQPAPAPQEEEDQLGDVNLTDEISKNVDEAFAGVEDLDDIEELDSDAVVKKITSKIVTTKYRASFMPERTEKEKARIERLTADQQKALQLPSLEDTKRKTIAPKTLGGYINTTNPTITTSKFANFDKEYTDKCLVKNIDQSIAGLANASSKVFCVGKEVEDSSDSQNLKELYTYYLTDEKGNKFTLKFDVPKIIDGSYVYINGSRKLIKHQLILKPIVKTGTDTVQIVTAYNKVFITREGVENQNTNRIRVFLDKNQGRFSARAGNASMTNSAYEVPLDFAMLSKYYSEFSIGQYTFFTSIDGLKAQFKRIARKELVYNENQEMPIGIDRTKKEAILLRLDESYTEKLLTYFDEKDRRTIAAIKRRPKYVVASAKIMKKSIPLILFMMYCEGFASVMKKANIKYEFVNKTQRRAYDPMRWDAIELNDGFIMWEKVPFRNELLMNGLKKCDLSEFTYDDLESKDTYVSIMLEFYKGNSGIHNALDNFRDFLIDEKTKEILTDFGYPTDLVSLMVVAAGMLTDTKYMIENNLNNMRVRSNEVIADIIYKGITSAYTQYRRTSYNKRPAKITVKRSFVIDTLLSSDVNMVEESSALNPVLEIEKQRAVSFKGFRGIQMDRAMTLPRRAYDRSMVGTLGISTPSDSNVGINRALTLEPAITSTYGYIDAEKSNHLDQLNAANLFTVAELLQPMGAMHDDPDRTAMSFKQTKYMIPINNADPVLIGNKVEATVPYLVSDEFVVDAKQDGKVVEVSEDYCVVEYKDGTHYAIDFSNRVQRNAAAGFWIDNTLKCDLKVGDKFKEGDILAYNNKHFTKNKEDSGASMNLGALCKIAISSQWDVFEDSAPISRKLSEKLSSEMVDEKHITFSPATHIDYIAQVGDSIKAGDPLVIFSDAPDAETQAWLMKMREDTKDTILETAKTTVSSKFTGVIADIKIYTTSELEDLEPSLRAVVESYWNRIQKRNAVLDKYKNSGDLGYYKAGQVIKEVAEVTKLGYNKKVAGYQVETGDVLILFYVKYHVAASKGDKVVCSVCKGIVSHVFEEGLEPYSEYRPDETIDTIVAPLAVSARKVPNIFLTIFGNKLIIELKRQFLDLYKKTPGNMAKKKEICVHRVIDVMNLLDPSGQNARNYQDKFEDMNDTQFDRWVKQFEKDEKQNFYLEIVEYERDLTIEQIQKCADFMKVPLLERVALPYLNGDSDDVVVTPYPVPVGYIHEKRMQQTLMKKSAGSTKIQKRSPLTGQVTAEDKNARNSDLESYSLAAVGANAALTEFMDPRADNDQAKREMYNDIAKSGYVSLKDLNLYDPYHKTALNTFNTYYLMMGVSTNLVTRCDKIPGPRK